MDLPSIGELAPDFSLPNQNGKTVELKSFKNNHLILWWYPVADTPG